MKLHKFLLDYLINLLEDADDFSWATAKASHVVLLCRIEQGEVKSWAEVEKIDCIRTAHAQRHVNTNTAQGQKHSEKGQSSGKTLPCVYFSKMHVFIRILMKQEECFTNRSVLLALLRKVRRLCILKWIVGSQKQKTSSFGYVIQMACPNVSYFL